MRFNNSRIQYSVVISYIGKHSTLYLQFLCINSNFSSLQIPENIKLLDYYNDAVHKKIE